MGIKKFSIGGPAAPPMLADADAIWKLKLKGFTEKEIRIPAPPRHRYNPELDKNEDDIMAYFEWIEFRLQEEHDDQ